MERALHTLESCAGTAYAIARLEDLLVLRAVGGDVVAAAREVSSACRVAPLVHRAPVAPCARVAAAARQWERHARWARRLHTIRAGLASIGTRASRPPHETRMAVAS